MVVAGCCVGVLYIFSDMGVVCCGGEVFPYVVMTQNCKVVSAVFLVHLFLT